MLTTEQKKHVDAFEYWVKTNTENGVSVIPESICKDIADLLKELKERRKAPEIIYCHECIHFQCNMRFDGSVPKGADAYECRHWCGGCDPMDYCCYAERRTE